MRVRTRPCSRRRPSQPRAAGPGASTGRTFLGAAGFSAPKGSFHRPARRLAGPGLMSFIATSSGARPPAAEAKRQREGAASMGRASPQDRRAARRDHQVRVRAEREGEREREEISRGAPRIRSHRGRRQREMAQGCAGQAAADRARGAARDGLAEQRLTRFTREDKKKMFRDTGALERRRRGPAQIARHYAQARSPSPATPSRWRRCVTSSPISRRRSPAARAYAPS